MGADGGSIPKRSEMVKLQAKEPLKSTSESWFYCNYSATPLQVPIVADLLGRLFNKTEILTALLKSPSSLLKSHNLFSIKQLKTLNVTLNNSPSSQVFSLDFKKTDLKPFCICPVTRREMNGKNQFSYLLNCGCVFSDLAFKEIQTRSCFTCGIEFTEKDIIKINPHETSIQDMIEYKNTVDAAIKDEIQAKIGKKKRKNREEEPLEKKIKVIEALAKEKIENDIKQSSAIASLYEKKPESKVNWACRGTFNRY